MSKEVILRQQDSTVWGGRVSIPVTDRKIVVGEYEGRELRAGRFWTEGKDGKWFWGWQIVYKGMWTGFAGNDVLEKPSLPLPERTIPVLARAAAYTLAEKTNTEGGEDFEDSILSILLELNGTEKETERDAEGSREPRHIFQEDALQDTPRAANRVS